VLRLVSHMRRVGLRVDANYPVFARYGTNRLDDLITLFERRLLDRGKFEQLVENLDTVLALAPTFTELEALILAWRASAHHRLYKFITLEEHSSRT